MSTPTFRVLVRGRFSDLDPGVRATLLREAGAHDVFAAAFTREGTLVYEPTLVNFYVRVTVDAEDDPAAASAAERMAAALLSGMHCGYRDLESSVTRMDDIKIRRRDRR